ncbi:ABC transporter permease [Spongiimicrobium salis]|uniref:ABC transporter permease n=1 Tax=Spongiimicrobium salis TaxID=1667022 RepID=UPI00374C962A
MLKNHLKIAWRNLKKRPFFTFLNTFGLAIGIAGGILISLYIYEELNFDTMFADADRIHRINLDVKFGGDAVISAEASAPMAAALEQDFPQVEKTVRFRNLGSMLLKKVDAQENVKELQVTYADSTMFDMFGIDLLYGDVKSALTQPNTLVLTKTAAEKHFGLNRAIGQQLVLDNSDTYTVAGIIDDFPRNSFLRDRTVFLSMVGYQDAQEADWGSHNYFTFIKVVEGTNMKEFQAPLQGMFGKYVIPYAQAFYPGITEEQFLASGNYLNYFTMPLTDIHLHSNMQTELSANSSVQNVYILSFIGLFLIVLASVNFMNLSTAHSLKRAKEVGVRKTLGSDKSELIRQFLTESGLITFISLLLAIIIATLALPYFNELAGKSISLPFNNPFAWLILIAATLILGFFSGSYPAFFMSKFRPAQVLKGGGKASIGGAKTRNSLVVFQFAISVFLMISTLVVYQQLNYIQSKDLGFGKDQVLIINDAYAAGNQLDSFKEQVQQLGQVKSVSLSSFLPTPSSRSNHSFFKEGAKDQENTLNMQRWAIDHDYISTMNMELIAGRDFNREFSADSTAIILNESALKVMGVSPQEAIGMRITDGLNEDTPTFFTIIGIVKNFHFESLREDIGALSMLIDRSPESLAIKLEAGNFPEAIAQIESLWEEMAPGQLFDYYFMEESFNNTYQAEQQLGRIFVAFTILSILIACLGLFGLAAFNAERRTKEIGIHKIMGATVSQVTYKLTVDFLKLVGIAILISIPLGWYAMSKWLEDFSYRIAIGWNVFVWASLLVIVISIVTVGYQSIKAAIVNPVKSLRTE